MCVYNEIRIRKEVSMCMPKTKVRLDFVVDEEHFKKLIALKNLYSCFIRI